MGIPRLLQDVAPYAETVIFQKVSDAPPCSEIGRVVVDGPSLVYHVFNTVLRSHRAQGLLSVPSYALINICLAQFLRDITTAGTEITSVIFDGALPAAKRQIRIERLEKTRQNLDTYRRLQNYDVTPSAPTVGASPPGLSRCTLNHFQQILWRTAHAATAQQRLIPSPPFMVASAIDFLAGSEWADIVHTVPDEADAYCASQAAITDSAVLSNDSDLLLYSLGPQGSAVTFATLELIEPEGQDISFVVRGKSLHPLRIAKKMEVPTMLLFGFHRLRDPSVSTSVIVQRARQRIIEEHDVTWGKFRKGYNYPRLVFSSLVTHHAYRALRSLDPRTAELVCSLENIETPHMYLPVTFEDPVRESSWSYGADIRRLAYSLLLRYYQNVRSGRSQNLIIEHSRKGLCIAENEVSVFSQGEICDKLNTIASLLQDYVVERIDDIDSNLCERSHVIRRTQQIETKLCAYYLLAADIAISERRSRSKTFEPSLSRLFISDRPSSSTSSAFIWDDVHFYCIVQCILYSLRILKQIMGYINHESRPVLSKDLRDILNPLQSRINDMPDIAGLFPSIIELHQNFCTVSAPILADLRHKLLRHMRSGEATRGSTRSFQANSSRDQIAPKQQENVTWHEPKKRTKKRQTESSLHGQMDHSNRTQNVSNLSNRRKSLNAFALLQDHTDPSSWQS